MACYRQVTACLLLGAALKKKGVVLPEIEPMLKFYAEHHIAFRPDSFENVIIKDMTGTFFPIDHINMGLQIDLYG
jgi:hypothetical protein